MAYGMRFNPEDHNKNCNTTKTTTTDTFTNGRSSRPTSDPTPAAAPTINKKSKAAFSSLGFGKGGSISNALGGATSGGGTKARKGLRGLFGHKKDSSSGSGGSSPSTTTGSSSGDSTPPTPTSVSERRPLTFTADSRKPLPALPEPAARGSIGRALWDRITKGGSVKDNRKTAANSPDFGATGVPSTLSHAPPFLTSSSPSTSSVREPTHSTAGRRTSPRLQRPPRESRNIIRETRERTAPVSVEPETWESYREQRNAAWERSQERKRQATIDRNKTYRLELANMFDKPAEPVSSLGGSMLGMGALLQASRNRTCQRPPASTGSTARPSLGNFFLGPLPSTNDGDHEDEPSLVSRVTSVRMPVATKPEMAELGYETVLASGVETVRRRSERSIISRERTAPLSIGSEESDMASSITDHLASIGVVNRANKTLHELVARLELSSPTASPASSPAKTLRSNINASLQSISSEATSMFPSPSPLGRVRAPGGLQRPLSSRKIKPKSRLSTAPEVAPVPPPVEETRPEAPTRSPSRSTFGHVEGLNDEVDSSDNESETGLPDDLLVILSDSDRSTMYGAHSDGSTASPPSSPAAVIQGLPPPPPTDRISPRRAQLQVNLPVPQAHSGWALSRSSQPAGSDDASSDGGVLSPGCRDSSTFDFTGEIGKLNKNIRASFMDQLHGGAPPVAGRQGKSRRSKSADETPADPFAAISSGHSRTSSSPQVKGVMQSNFKFGSPLPSVTAAAAAPRPAAPVQDQTLPTALPTFAFRAPTPCSPPRSTFLPETSFMCLDSPSSSSDATDMDVDMDEFDTRRFSIVSDNSVKQRERRAGQTHRRTGHDAVQSSATSFASISSLGRIISGGSPDPFAFDFPSERSMQTDPDASLASSFEERSRMDSTFSAVTQSSLGVQIRGTHGVVDPFNFSGMRIGESFSTTHTRHNRTFSSESGRSNFSYQDPNSSGSFGRASRHRRQSSIASIASVGGVLPPLGPPVSMYNKPKAYAVGNVNLRSQRSSSGRPDWARHRRQQSSMDSQASAVGGRFERPGVGDKMFATDQGEQLFSITAFPNGSADDSFESQLQAHAVHQIVEERSDSSEDDHCRTSLDESSFDQVAVRKHGHMSSNGSDSIFHSTDESFGRSLSFAIKPLRPISGVSAVSSSSDSGEPNEDDTFAFRRQNIAAPSPKPKIARSPRNQQRQPSKSPSARPMSVVSNTSSVFSGANDTFANTKHRAAPLPFSLPKLTHDKPVARSAVVAAAGVSPLRIKRKAVPLLANVSTESPRKARLVDGSEIERSSAETLKSVKMPTKGMTARPSLEDSCLQAQGEDLSFSSQELSMTDSNMLSSSTNTNLSASTASSRRSTASSRPRAPSRIKTSSNRSRPSTLAFSPAPPDTPPMTSPSASESSYAQSNQSLDLSHLMSSLATATVNTAAVARPRARRPDMAHRRRTSGAKGPVIVQQTIHEERSVPSLSGSSPPSTANSLESAFPSPMFLQGREPDIAAYDDDPEALDAMRGWREWERDARYEHGKSQAKWLDTEYSAAMMANFCPPTKATEVKAFVAHSQTTFLKLSSPSKSSLLIHRRSSSLTESRLKASPYAPVPAPITIPLKTKLRSKRPSPLPTKFGGSSPLLANFPPAPPSAKFVQQFAHLARERPVTPPPSLDVDIPGALLAGPWEAEVEKKQPSSSSVKKAKRISEEVRRSKLGWARRKTSDANGAIVMSTGNASVKEVVLDKVQAAKAKRTSLIYQDAPTSKTAQMGLPHVAYKPNNKENFFMHSNGAIKPLITQRTSSARTSSSLIPRPIRA